MASLAEAVVRVQERIAGAARRAGRDPAGVTLVAVTKTVPLEIVWQAYQLGLRHFGENRIEEAEDKIPNLKLKISNSDPTSNSRTKRPTSNFQSPREAPTPQFHMIGHLQSRKAREAVALFDVIQSVDSLKLAQKLSRLCVESARLMPALLECNVSGEETKYGFRAMDDPHFLAEVEAIVGLPGIRVDGLMTMAPIVSDPQQVRPVFAALRQLGERLSSRLGAEHFRQLSMGMTDDFEVAVEEGATMVRIGRALFDG